MEEEEEEEAGETAAARKLMMVDMEYIACRYCASQCYTSHHDEIRSDDRIVCEEEEEEEEEEEASCRRRTRSTSTHAKLFRDAKNSLILRHRRRPHIAPSFICVVCTTMLPHNQLHPHLRFPKSFADCHLSKCVGEAMMEGPSGWQWHAQLQKLRDSMTLSSPGWATFAQDHGLETGDMLVFTYIGRNSFKVRIFGLKEGHMEKGKGCTPSTAKLLCANEYNEGVNCGSTPEEVQEPFPQSTRIEFLCSSNHIEPHSLQNYIGKEEGPCAPRISAKFLSSNDEEGELAQEIALKRAKAIHETIACKLSNPTITKLLTISAVRGDFKLVFPMPFVRRHMPSKNVSITFVDPSRRSWQCKWLGEASTRERLYVCGGWQPFVRAHALNANDVCIFELVDEQALCFTVHIFKS